MEKKWRATMWSEESTAEKLCNKLLVSSSIFLHYMPVSGSGNRIRDENLLTNAFGTVRTEMQYRWILSDPVRLEIDEIKNVSNFVSQTKPSRAERSIEHKIYCHSSMWAHTKEARRAGGDKKTLKKNLHFTIWRRRLAGGNIFFIDLRAREERHSFLSNE